MATLNEVIRERRAYIRQLGRSLRAVDTQVEAMQRIILRINNRRRKVPEERDLEKIAERLRNCIVALNIFTKSMNEGYPL